MRLRTLLLAAALGLTAGCNPPGNVSSVNAYQPPPAPPVAHPLYDPYAPYGEAHATWTPPVYDRNGTIVAPLEPATAADRADYEHAPWATGALGSSQLAPPGTF
jgi:hypothetical protein